MGNRPSEMMDREKAYIPELQISFMEHIAMPIYKCVLSGHFPTEHVAVAPLPIMPLCKSRDASGRISQSERVKTPCDVPLGVSGSVFWGFFGLYR